MNNPCTFSPCRNYRYTLEHVIAEAGPLTRDRRIQWIGLNPSTADENKLDNTLKRVRAFSLAWGFGGFVMTNVFGYRATKPAVMRAQPDPIGGANDHHLLSVAKRCEVTVACWGGLSNFPRSLRPRAASIRLLFASAGRSLMCLELNQDGSPMHPLYVDGETPLKPYIHR